MSLQDFVFQGIGSWIMGGRAFLYWSPFFLSQKRAIGGPHLDGIVPLAMVSPAPLNPSFSLSRPSEGPGKGEGLDLGWF